MKLLQKTALALIRFKFRLIAVFSKRRAAESAFDLFSTPQKRNLRPLPAVFTNATIIHTTFQDSDIVGYTWNQQGTRKAMVIHGHESSVVNFDFYISGLIGKGYHVFAFDAPAHGRSGGTRITALSYMQFIEYIITTYGPIDAFFAHSLGALALAMALAETHHTSSTKVALVAPATDTSSTIAGYLRLIGITEPGVRKAFNDIVPRISGHDVAWFSVGRAMKNIHARVLWVHDQEDTVTPYADAAAVAAENHPNLHFVTTTGLGHRRIYLDKEVGRTIVDFL